MIDAKNSVSYGTRPYAMEIAKVLGGLYDDGKILMITGSAQQNIIMQASGIPLTNFHTAIEEFNLLIIIIKYHILKLIVDMLSCPKSPTPAHKTMPRAGLKGRMN